MAKALSQLIVFKDLPWYYAELLEWHVDDGIIRAFPKKPLSDKAHKEVLRAFKLWGGGYVSHNGEAYFEAVILPRVASIPVALKIERAYEELQKEAGF